MTPEEAEKLLKGGGEPIVFSEEAARQNAAATQFPLPGPLLQRMAPAVADEEFRAANAEPGVEFDVSSGVSPWERLMLELRSNRENQIKYLEGQYGKGAVRFSDNNEMIVRMPDPKNPEKVKDVLVNPHDMNAGDFMGLIANFPEIAGSIYAMRTGKKIPFLQKSALRRYGTDVVAGTLGGEAAGAAKDIGMNLIGMGEPRTGEVLSEHAGRLPIMGAMSAGGSAIGPIWKFVKSPLHSYRGTVQFEGMAAQKYLRDKFGIDVPLTIGQSTGNPLAGRSEVFIEKLPGGSGPVRQIYAEQEAQLRRLQELIMGKDLPTDEELGRQVMATLQTKVRGAGMQAERAGTSLADTASNAIDQRVSALTAPAKELHREETGKALREAVIAKRDAAKAQGKALYDYAKTLPGGSGKIFDGTPLQQSLEGILSKLPSMEHDVTTVSQILNPVTQKPVINTAVKNTVLDKWIPPDLIPRIRQITDAVNPKFDIWDLRQLHTDVMDALGQPEAVGSTQKSYLRKIGVALEDMIDQSVNSLPTGQLKTALQDANRHWKNNVIPFNRAGISDLFAPSTNPAKFVSDAEVMERLFSGKQAIDNWNAMKQTLGASSPEFVRARRAVADTILESSRDLATGNRINAKDFVSKMYKLQQQYRTIYDDVFTPTEREVFKQARFLDYAKGDKIDQTELASMLASPGASAQKLRDLIAAERNRDKVYANQIMKAVGDGSLNAATIKPSVFLDRMVDNSQVSISEIQQVMDLIRRQNPALAEDVQRKTVEQIFSKAQRSASAEDVALMLEGKATRIISGRRIAESMTSGDYRKKLELILGPEMWKDLKAYVNVQTMLESTEESFRAAGGIAAGTQVAQSERILEQGGLLKYGGNVGRSFIFSWLLTNPMSRRLLTRVPKDPKAATVLLHTLLASPQFLEAAQKEFGKSAVQFVHNITGALGRGVQDREEFDRRQSAGRVGPQIGKWDAFLATGTNAPPAQPAGKLGQNEEIRSVRGRPAVFNATTHLFVRWLNP